jgi:hypothetical protein
MALDLMGPLPHSAYGNEYILVVDYAKKVPEAIPLRLMTTKAIAKELYLTFSRVGLPATILTDQGTLHVQTDEGSVSVIPHQTNKDQCVPPPDGQAV